MSLTSLLADSVIGRWITRRGPDQSLALAMTGVKLGERCLVVGCTDPWLLAALGGRVGLSGSTCAVDVDPESAARAGTVAEREGVLVDVRAAPSWSMPFEHDSFDVAVLRTGGTLTRDALGPALRETLRVLRPGGRAVVISRPDLPGTATAEIARAQGYRGVRTLAERDQLVFVEAVRARN